MNLLKLRAGGSPALLVLFVFLAVFPFTGHTQAPDPELESLMNRRSELLRKWRQFNLEENALFGGKSKKDLKNIVRTQKDIIDLDNRILNTGRMAQYAEKKAEKAEGIEQQRSFYSRIDSLRTARARAEQQIEAFRKREASLQETIGRQRSFNRGLSIALVVAIALLLISLFYNPMRKRT